MWELTIYTHGQIFHSKCFAHIDDAISLGTGSLTDVAKEMHATFTMDYDHIVHQHWTSNNGCEADIQYV